MPPVILAPLDLLPLLDVPRTPQQRRSHTKWERLLPAAEAVFQEHGYRAAMVDAITARARVSTGTFYSCFHDTQQLLVLLVGEQLNALTEPLSLLELRSHPRTALEQLGLGSGRVWHTWKEAVTQDVALADLHRTITAWMESTVFQVLDRVGAEDGLRPDLDRTVTARLLTILLFRALLEPLDEPVIRAMAGMIYHALFTDQATR